MRGGESVHRRLRDGVDGEHERAGDEKCAEHVGSAAHAETAVICEQSRRRHSRDRADGHVDEEDPVPAHGLGDETAGEKADGRARGGNEAEHSEGLGLLVGLREQRDDHGQDHG